MKVLITGANSMLGCNVVETLYAAGVEIVALVRRSNDLIDKCSKVVLSDVENVNMIKLAAQECSVIVHIAAVTDTFQCKLKDYRFNWETTEKIAIVAKEMGLKVVFISSANTIGNGTIDDLADENRPINDHYINSLYGQSKVIAEAKLLNILPTAIILNPTFMIGKYDSKPSSGYIIQRGFRKKIIFMPCGGKNFVPARDVANAVLMSIKSGGAGKYILGGVEMTFNEFIRLLAKVNGYSTKIIVLPKWVLNLTGLFGDFTRLIGMKGSMSSANMKILNQREFYTSQKAINEWNYTNSSLDYAIKEASEWMQQNGKL